MFVATVIRSAFGFGEALIAVPLLALFIPVQVGAPLAVLVSITIAAVVVVQDWRHIHLRSAGWLVLSTIFGIPLGLLLLTRTPEHLIKLLLGGVILLFALFSLTGGLSWELRHDSRGWMLACGFIAGILGGAYGMNGPPLVIYGSLRKWTAQHFRATLQAYFLPASVLGMCGYLSAGMWTPVVTRDFLLCLPVMLPAVFLGRLINHRLSAAAFSTYIYIGLAGIGLALMLQPLLHFG
ncbi:MAG TPA: sulfite exporter TauE/SafE family protein [Terracidiphilus sp.]|nr:sulfite exporter TauE/SafE family protein [Terracidiphilus sp.]